MPSPHPASHPSFPGQTRGAQETNVRVEGVRKTQEGSQTDGRTGELGLVQVGRRSWRLLRDEEAHPALHTEEASRGPLDTGWVVWS